MSILDTLADLSRKRARTDQAVIPETEMRARVKALGAVNVSALKADSPSAEVLAVRVRKEMWRAFAYVMGAAHSSFPGCLMTTVTSLGELDTVRAETISPEPLQKINQHAGKLGMTRNRVGTYKRACAEGWAPPPENEWQRKIAEEVKKAEAEKKAAEKK